MEAVFFESGTSLLRTALIGVGGYAAIAALLRLSGKRSLAKLNMFDFVVTVALGSILAAMMTGSSVTLSQGVTAFAVLLAMQWGVTFIAARSRSIDEALKAEPRLIFHRGEMLRGAMRAERVAESEIYAAARDSSIGDLDRVAAMVLESDGTISVVAKDQAGGETALPVHKE